MPESSPRNTPRAFKVVDIQIVNPALIDAPLDAHLRRCLAKPPSRPGRCRSGRLCDLGACDVPQQRKRGPCGSRVFDGLAQMLVREVLLQEGACVDLLVPGVVDGERD